MKPLRVYIGWDLIDAKAAEAAASSLARVTSIPLDIVMLRADVLAAHGLLRRPVDDRGGMYDLMSRAPQSTNFAISRFVVPMLAHGGLALFVDADVVFLDDPKLLVADAVETPGKAVWVVKHRHEPTAKLKMGVAQQTAYPRKNWSSVCLWDCDHPANRRLSLDDVNHRPGRDLHAFYWLAESEIGELPPRWNWLVNEQLRPADAGIAHFTNGGPWLPEWKPAPHDEIWKEAAR